MGSSAKLGSRSTGEEALRGADLSGKTAVVTGGNAGLGTETVRVLANAGAKVILGCRDVPSGEKIASALRETGLKVGLSLTFARQVCQDYKRPYILIVYFDCTILVLWEFSRDKSH